MSERGKGLRVMSIASGVIIRHLLFSYNISLTAFPGMLISFAVLLLGQALQEDEFFSKRTIRNHIMRLSMIDDYFFAKNFDDVSNRK